MKSQDWNKEVKTAWVAAFYEGEGCISFHNRGGRHPELQWIIVQVNKEPLVVVQEWLQDIGITANIRQSKNGCHRLSVSNYPDIQVIFDFICDYISSNRKAQLDDAIENFLDWSKKYGRG